MKVKEMIELLGVYSPEQEIMTTDFLPVDLLEVDGDLFITSHREEYCYE